MKVESKKDGSARRRVEMPERINTMRKWMPKLLRVAGIGACYGMAVVALASLLFAFREPDALWDAWSLSSPARISITLVSFTIASGVGGALCALPIYFVCWLLRGRFAEAMRHD